MSRIEAGARDAPPREEGMLGQWAKAMLDALEAEWHNEAAPPELAHADPLEGLVLTVLSQNTNDRNRDAAFARLVERFLAPAPDAQAGWEAVVETGASALEDAIRPAGLAPTKAARIIEILQIVRRDMGGYSLLPLADREPEAVRAYLTSLPGVGAKTAACVMLFDMGMPAFPVDTHIARISRRVGLVPPRMSPDDISETLERIVPPARWLGAHVNMIVHGRAVCRARGPRCETCAISHLCEEGRATALARG